MRVAIYSRGLEQDQLSEVQQLIAELREQSMTPVFCETLFRQHRDQLELDDNTLFFSSHEQLQEIECIISLGGDGTLLDTITLVRDKNIPILGINFGRLGFLASLGKEELHTAVLSLTERSFVTDKRTLLHLDANLPLFGETPYALNEFAILKKETSSMIKIHTYLNGEFLNTYWADGLIVSTPTGSTGYSLSCNGPIVFPDSGTFVITPVAPHNLNVRPIVVPDHNVISFEVEGRTDQFICTMDSRKETVSKDTQLAVRKEQFTVNLIRLNENNFLKTLRNKLSWGLDKRN